MGQQVLIDSDSLTAIGDAIRNKNGSIIKYKPAEMAAAIKNIKNETYVESNDSWGIVINQQEHETVTAKPVASVKTEGDRYRSKLSLELGVSAWTQYIPGQITQSFDTVNKNFVIDIAPATPVDNMVTEDGWGKVYIKDSKFYDNENYSGSPLSDLSGNILVAGAQTNNFTYSISSKNSLLKYKDNFTIKAANNFLYQCTNLTSVDLPNLTTIGDEFLYNCTSLTSVDLPNLTTTGDSFLSNCNNLTSVDLSNLTTIGRYSMYKCSNLTSVDLSNLTTTGDYLMEACSNLTSVDLHNLITTGYFFMRKCSKLTSIDLSNITSIGSDAFYDCNALKYIVIDNNTVSKAQINPASGVKVLIPQSMMDAYSADSYWSSYTSQLDAIENYTITRENGQITIALKQSQVPTSSYSSKGPFDAVLNGKNITITVIDDNIEDTELTALEINSTPEAIDAQYRIYIRTKNTTVSAADWNATNLNKLAITRESDGNGVTFTLGASKKDIWDYMDEHSGIIINCVRYNIATAVTHGCTLNDLIKSANNGDKLKLTFTSN